MSPVKTLTSVLTINPEVQGNYLNSTINITFWNLFPKQKKYSQILYDFLTKVTLIIMKMKTVILALISIIIILSLLAETGPHHY